MSDIDCVVSMIRCPKCQTVHEMMVVECPACGHDGHLFEDVIDYKAPVIVSFIDEFMGLVDDYADAVASLGVVVGAVDIESPRDAVEAKLRLLIASLQRHTDSEVISRLTAQRDALLENLKEIGNSTNESTVGGLQQLARVAIAKEGCAT